MRIVGNPPSGGKQPTTPTIGTATDDGTGTGVSVAFTPSTYIGKGTITYTATSSPGSLTGTGSGSPITVSGLTTGTTYSFTVAGTTNYGVSSLSSAQSNFVTPTLPTSFESIATYNPTSGSSVTFNSIPSTYKHLQIRFLSYTTSGADYPFIRFNSDSGSNYVIHRLYGNPPDAVANSGTAQTSIATSQNTVVNYPLVGVIDIIDYASSSKNKTVRIFSGFNTNNSSSQRIQLFSGLWLNTNAITSITVANNASESWASGTSIALYGIKG